MDDKRDVAGREFGSQLSLNDEELLHRAVHVHPHEDGKQREECFCRHANMDAEYWIVAFTDSLQPEQDMLASKALDKICISTAMCALWKPYPSAHSQCAPNHKSHHRTQDFDARGSAISSHRGRSARGDGREDRVISENW